MGPAKEVTRMPRNRRVWPTTVEEAVNQILSSLSDEDKEALKNMPNKDLIKFHMGRGAGIRNDFGLWGDNEDLLKSCGAEWMPDSASEVIIEAVWKRLQK